MATKQGGQGGGRSGRVKDPEHDGRLKENRESGRTKSPTQAAAQRGEHSGNKPEQGGRESSDAAPERKGGQDEQPGGADDLKSRGYRDAEGNIHHHTREYMERQGKK